METKETALLFDSGAARNSLNTSVLIIFRVAVCSTLKTVKSLILNALQGAPSVSAEGVTLGYPGPDRLMEDLVIRKYRSK